MLGSRSFVNGRVLAIIFVGVTIRVALHRLGFQSWLEGTAELVVPHASWERAREGLFLGSLGLSRYAGGVFSGSPLMLVVVSVCDMLPESVRMLGATLIFTAFDIISALLLRAMCQHVASTESRDWETGLEAWMDKDSRPPDYNPHPTIRSSSQGTKTVEVAETSSKIKGADVILARDKNRETCGGGSSLEGQATREGGLPLDLPDMVLAVYFLNPIMAGQCAALSGDVLGRVLPLGAVVAGATGSLFVTGAALAAATCLYRFHAALLIVPLALMLTRGAHPRAGSALSRPKTCGGIVSGRGGTGTQEEGRHDNKVDMSIRQRCSESEGRDPTEDRDSATKGHNSNDRGDESDAIAAYFLNVHFDPLVFLRLFSVFAASCALLLGVCWLGNSSSWEFLRAAVAGQLLCDDLTPNTGLYWYFFAQIFARFRGFFRVLFLSQPYLYVVPVALRVGMFPEATATILLAIFGFFQTHPTLADTILAGCLFLCHPRSAMRMRFVLPLGLMAMVPALLLPTMRHVWLKAGTGNANFYYFQSVALNIFVSVFILQFISAMVKRRRALAVALRKRRQHASHSDANAGQRVSAGLSKETPRS